jgi:hypothetical protein
VNTNDALARLRSHFPAQMTAVDAMLTRAGFITSSGSVAPGCDDRVRTLTLTKIPHANSYFHNLAPQDVTAATTGATAGGLLQQPGDITPQ